MAEIELGYGKKAKDWAIRSQAPNLVMVKSMGKVQRLNVCGSQMMV
jgi:hypothetical protein